ncbi:MAG TPA: alpha/beta hydrolase, partial [Chitinophagaceae bacterium]|nr:alpha/beta hydrolase [Chitinophagaceae bacterium]
MRVLLLTAIAFGFVFNTAAQVQNIDTLSIGDNAKAGHYIRTRGFQMYYEIYGNGLPVVMLHNNGGSISNFMYQVPYFAQGFKVIAVDSRAQGKSADKGDSLSYEMMADDVNALLDSLKLYQCFVIGWNDGAITGLLLAIHHPDKVAKLALAGARLSPDTSAMDDVAVTWAMQYYRSIERLSQTKDTRNKSKVVRLLSYGPHIPADDLKKIACPVLVIGGDHDVVLPRHALLIASLIPDSYLWILPGAGNAIPID